MMLLSKGETNHKIKKNIKLGYYTSSLNLAHSDLSGFNVCPIANKLTEQENNPKKSNCSFCCVAGNGFAEVWESVLESRINKTLTYFLDRQAFLERLVIEVNNAVKLAKKKDLKPTFRLNAYSDIRWEKDIIEDGKNIFDLFPETDFYDYTKLLNRTTPKNYQLTYSHHNSDFIETTKALESGLNCAIVFQKLPKFIRVNGIKYTVLNGDETDLRLDEKINGQTVVVGLKFKGSKAKLNDAIIEGFCIAENNNSLEY